MSPTHISVSDCEREDERGTGRQADYEGELGTPSYMEYGFSFYY